MLLRILTENNIREIMDMDEAIEIQRKAFGLIGEDAVVSGLRSFATSDTPPGIAIFNPAFLKEGQGYGVKVVSDFFDNEQRGLTRMSSLVSLFDGKTGHPTTVMEGGYLTDLRTGAGTGLAASYLAREDSQVLAVIGAGRVARNQIDAVSRVCPISEVLISTRTPTRGHLLSEYLAGQDRWDRDQIKLVNSPDEAVSEADIVISATTSLKPTFSGTCLKEGVFVAAVGANIAEAREVDSIAISRMDKLVIDSRDESLKNCGDLMVPLQEQKIALTSIADLSELVNGTITGRENANQLTYYKSIGLPIQDLAMAQAIEAKAIASDIGTVIEMGG